VVVDVERAGVCGTDVEFFTGEMSYLHTGRRRTRCGSGTSGRAWCPRSATAWDTGWVGRRVTGDTMLGCGVCARCTGGRQHTCADRYEIGIRNGWPGALAEQLPVPVRALQPLPDDLDAALGALVEPAATRCAPSGEHSVDGQRLLVLGPGTIGLLVRRSRRRTASRCT
jgi:threonine dehydrogenase-like Zn-dependent dehydrogenase